MAIFNSVSNLVSRCESRRVNNHSVAVGEDCRVKNTFADFRKKVELWLMHVTQGGIIGPWLVGILVEHTGGYGMAMQILGFVMCIAAAMAFFTRSWEGRTMDSGGHSGKQQQGEEAAALEMQGLLTRVAKS
jgi:hypothetical protein